MGYDLYPWQRLVSIKSPSPLGTFCLQVGVTFTSITISTCCCKVFFHTKTPFTSWNFMVNFQNNFWSFSSTVLTSKLISSKNPPSHMITSMSFAIVDSLNIVKRMFSSPFFTFFIGTNLTTIASAL